MKRMRIPWATTLLAAVTTSFSMAQTTQGLIRGKVQDALTGAPIAQARVEYRSSEYGQAGAVRTSPDGDYVLPSLSPGRYRLRVLRDGYQPQEIFDLPLNVAAFLEFDFRLRPLSDVWETGQYRSVFGQGGRGVVTAIGPDFDGARTATLVTPEMPRGSLEASVSSVVQARELNELPLTGRDAYALLVTHPGVVTDSGTARGLGLSVNGLRPSASSFLLDGVENNNYLVTGPLLALPPEAIEEYRISSNLFSAEYGRAGGYLANAITRAGSERWHGTAYSYFKHEGFNANGFQRNRRGEGRAEDRELQAGVTAGGPMQKDRTYLSASFDYSRNRAQGDPVSLDLPTNGFGLNTMPQSLARKLLDQSSAFLPTGTGFTSTVTLQPPVGLNRLNSLLRADRLFSGGRNRLLLRLLGARLKRPHFIWTPYETYSSPLMQTSLGFLAGIIATPRPALTIETRTSYSISDLGWDRAHPEIPTLSTGSALVLPGSPAFYGYRNRGAGTEALANLLWVNGRHIAKFGGGVLLRRTRGRLTMGQAGDYYFPTIIDFYLDSPGEVRAGVIRRDLAALNPREVEDRYRNRQVHLFAQDSWKLGGGLMLNAGIRYENFGSPVVDSRDGASLVELSAGSTLAEGISNARLGQPLRKGAAVYDSDNNDFAGRFGFAWNPTITGSTVVRGGYGIFYDRPFDNLWHNIGLNNVELVAKTIPFGATDYLAPVTDVLRRLPGSASPQYFPEALLLQANLRTAYIQSYFGAFEHRIGDSLALQVSTLGSLGRKLITTDRLNRERQSNARLPIVTYRANQGSSHYRAMNATARYRSGPVSGQVSYTFGSGYDNQSEPLAGDFFDLNFTRNNYSADRPGVAAFSRMGDSSADIGHSDFDQRHNLVLLGVWQLPGRLRAWRLSGLAAFRSGFPYSVLAAGDAGGDVAILYHNRANAVPGRSASLSQPADGGVLLLDAKAFVRPGPGQLGQTRRNHFRGPSIHSADISAGRNFRFGERVSLVLRADAYNILNHANLNPPDNQLDSPTFGVALYGRKGRGGGFPALIPFDETARRIQAMLRIEF